MYVLQVRGKPIGTVSQVSKVKARAEAKRLANKTGEVVYILGRTSHARYGMEYPSITPTYKSYKLQNH